MTESRAKPDDAWAVCQRCKRPIRYGQPYMPRIPFIAAWAGLDHQYCPPRLVVTTPRETR